MNQDSSMGDSDAPKQARWPLGLQSMEQDVAQQFFTLQAGPAPCMQPALSRLSSNAIRECLFHLSSLASTTDGELKAG